MINDNKNHNDILKILVKLVEMLKNCCFLSEGMSLRLVLVEVMYIQCTYL